MKEMEITEGYIITYNEEKTIETDTGIIHVLPAWQWLLNL
jgi:predicted AAA+ superfamily ATPase